MKLSTVFLLFLSVVGPVWSQEAIAVPDQALALPPVARYGRSPFPSDPVHARIAEGKWQAPKEGDGVAVPGRGEAKWAKVAIKDGVVQGGPPGSYVSIQIKSETERFAILQTVGSAAGYVNGELRTGDIYRNGYLSVPIALRKGDNDLLFQVARGPLSLKLTAPKAAAQFQLADMTTPDLVVGEMVDVEAAIVVLNAQNAIASKLVIEAQYAGTKTLTPVPTIAPAASRKIGFRVRGPAPTEAKNATVELRLLQGDAELDRTKFELECRKPSDHRKVTFRSEIDGSVQYYGLVPALPEGDQAAGLVLTLHGASVEAIGQARAYGPKAGMHIVAPTNRRPFGFDWEDWGRWDAIEVLELASKSLKTDPSRTYLTGHSMGGHGTWHVGVTFPDRFAAIGPSAGWVSMWSYAGMKKDTVGAVEDMLFRASNASDTLSLVRNYAPLGVYVLHGDADDNVPVDQARSMRRALSEFHRDFAYFEEPGAGHWWGKEGVNGSACVDWPAMFQFFSARRLPASSQVREARFVTASPGVSSRYHWASIEAQQKYLLPSSIAIRRDVAKKTFDGTTGNVARLSLDTSGITGPVEIKLDGSTLKELTPKNNRVTIARNGDKWEQTEPSAALKGPTRYGPFKEAFRNRFVLVYGTTGNEAENAWSLAKARYDAEQFWYRGNGSVDVIADRDFDAAREPDRNVIVYGNTDTNSAWKSLLASSPIQASRGTIVAGARTEKGEDLGVIVVRPRAGSDRALVAGIGGSGLNGMRTTDRLPYFVSGVGYADWAILDGTSTTRGIAGVRGAGYFGIDWKLESGESAWR